MIKNFYLLKFENWKKTDIFVLYLVYVFIIIPLFYMILIETSPPTSEQKMQIGKNIVIKNGFRIIYRRSIGRSPDYIVIIPKEEKLELRSSCIGLREENKKPICIGEKSYYLDFDDNHELKFFIRHASKDVFNGLLLSVKDNRTGEILFNNLSEKEYLTRKSLLEYTIKGFLIYAILYLIFATKKLLSLSSKKD